MTDGLEGGCFCGALRYRVLGAPIDAGYCHCRMCQRACGAPAVAWGTWQSKRLLWLAGEARTLHSSTSGQRRFCADCGTQLLFWTADRPDRIDVNVATLDRPEAVAPQYHSWTASRIAWFDTADHLPRFADAGPDAPAERHPGGA